MKSWINRIDQWFYRYRKLNRLIDERTNIKTVSKSVLGALILSLLIIALPTLVIINMFIFTKLTVFLAILLVMMITMWPFLYFWFYYQLLKNYHESLDNVNTRIPYVVESSIMSFILLTIGVIVLSIIF